MSTLKLHNKESEFWVADARELTFEQEFDGAICLYEGAFGLAGSEENQWLPAVSK